MIKKQWIYEHIDNEKFNRLKKSLKLTDALITILLKRNIYTFDEAKEFFRPDISQLKDPFLLKGVNEAIERITEAIKKKEKILIYGDYDVDGVTSVSIMYKFFIKIYTNIFYYIPDRHKEGYGISINSINLAKQNNYDLIIALDCGTCNIEEIALAKQLSIDVIVIDHHIPLNILPDVVALINPKQSQCNYPFKEFAACGLCLKFIQAFAIKYKIATNAYYSLIELAAIGTASDLVPLVKENRVITFLGLKELNANPSVGLQSILDVCQLQKPYNTQDIAFKIAPLINAAGRMAHAHIAVELFTTKNIETAKDLALTIYNYNQLRKKTEREATAEALQLIHSEQSETYSTVIYNEKWHKGVIGIVASKLQEFQYKPTIVLTKSNNLIVGSARSVEGFNIYNGIHACRSYLEQYGGHKYAAGLSMNLNNIEIFKKSFEEFTKKNITINNLVPKIKIDAVISLRQITQNFIKIISEFEPFGQLNESLIFVSKNIQIHNGINIINNQHLKFYIKQDNAIFECIAFNLAHIYNSLIQAQFLTICYTVSKNIWKDKTKIQLIIKDIKIATNNVNQKINNISNVCSTSN